MSSKASLLAVATLAGLSCSVGCRSEHAISESSLPHSGNIRVAPEHAIARGSIATMVPPEATKFPSISINMEFVWDNKRDGLRKSIMRALDVISLDPEIKSDLEKLHVQITPYSYYPFVKESLQREGIDTKLIDGIGSISTDASTLSNKHTRSSRIFWADQDAPLGCLTERLLHEFLHCRRNAARAAQGLDPYPFMQEERKTAAELVDPGIRILSKLNSLGDEKAKELLGESRKGFSIDFISKLSEVKFNEEGNRQEEDKF